MATSKSTLASASYITTNSSTTVTPTFVAEPVVFDGKLIPGTHITNPGVFTAGTAQTGTVGNPNNDSNA